MNTPRFLTRRRRLEFQPARYATLVIVLALVVLVPVSWAQSTRTAQNASMQSPAHGINNEQYLSVLSLSVAILAGIATLTIATSGVMTWVQSRRLEKERDRIREEADRIIEEGKQATHTLQMRVKDYRSPESILSDARKEAEKYCQREVNALRVFIDDHKDALEEKVAKFEDTIRRDRERYDKIREDVETARGMIDKKPSINDVIVEIDNRYDKPMEIRLLVLAQIKNAFDCLANLSQEERSLINQALAATGKDGETKPLK